MGGQGNDVTRAGTATQGTYHHGSVATSAVEAATDVVRSHGVEALTVRKVASRIGVTHTALYRHFDGRAELVDLVAADWLGTAVRRLDGAPDFADVIDRYVRWALESEHLYRCTFELTADSDASAKALVQLRDVVATAYRRDVGGTPAEVRDGVFASWGQIHGLVDLYWKRLLRAADDDRAASYIVGLATDSRHITSRASETGT